MNRILVTVALCSALLSVFASAAESRRIKGAPLPLSADPEVAREAKDVYQKLWVSQFTQGMRRDPDAFRNAVFTGYGGTQADQTQAMASINDSIIRYGKNLPGIGSGFSLLEEFAKDSRQWKGGIEERKSAAVGAINRCPDCMGRFANDTYDLLLKQKRGQTLTPDEKVVLDGLNGQIGKGVFKDVDASWNDLAAGANPNDMVIWQGKAVLGVFSDLSNMDRAQYRSLLKNSREFRSFVSARLGSLDKTMADGFSEMRAKFSEITQQSEAAAARQTKLIELSSHVSDFQVGAGLAVSLLNASGRGGDAQRLSVVSTAALSAYETMLRRSFDPQQVSQFAATASTFNAVLVIASVMQDQKRKTETQYVLEALQGMSEQIAQLSADVGNLRQQVQTISVAIERLRRSNDAQYSALYDKLKALGEDFADDRLRRWMTERSKVSSRIEKLKIKCKTLTNKANGIDFNKAPQGLQEDFRSQCLSPLLAVMTVDAAATSIVGESRSPISGDASIRMFKQAMQGKVSPELWYPMLGDDVPLSRNEAPPSAATSGTAERTPPQVPGSEGAVLAQPIDLELWRDAMNAYASAILTWPTYVPTESKPEDKIILELEESAVRRAEQVRQWLDQRLSTNRFDAAVESYRESTLYLLRALRAQAESFLLDKRAQWCSEESRTALRRNIGADEERWSWVACEDPSADGSLRLSEETANGALTAWIGKTPPIFPVELLIFRDEFQESAKRLGARAGAPKLAVSDGRKFSRDELSLITGLRMIDSADFVLYRLTPDAPEVKRDAIVTISTPKTPSRADNWACLRKAVRVVEAGDVAGALKICTTEARQGCSVIKDKSRIANFSYKLCDGPIKLPDDHYHGLRDAGRDWDRITDLWTQRIADLSESRNREEIRSSFVLRRYGIGPDLISANGGIVNHRLRIKGIDSQGLPSPEGVIQKSSGLSNFKFEIEEEYAVDQAEEALGRVEGRLTGLQVEFLQHLKSEDSAASLRRHYDQLNRSYATLMLHAYLYLQLDAFDTPALRKFLSLPISGHELAESFAAKSFPSRLGQRLLLSNDLWSKGFPTIDAFEYASDRMTSRDCAPEGRDRELTYPPRKDYWLNLRVNSNARSELAEDMYCRMWAEQVAKLEPSEANPFFPGTLDFNRGSLFLNDGLDAWARVSNERMLRKRLIAVK